MKFLCLFLVMALLLAGCQSQETFETVTDVMETLPAAARQQFLIRMPGDAVTPTFQEENNELYVCGDYTISKQILESGNLEQTVKTISGKSCEELDLIKTVHDTHDRYDFVWAAAGEDGLQVGRACILDDGNYHYVVTAMAGEEEAEQLQTTLGDMFDSCWLLSPEVDLSIGS